MPANAPSDSHRQQREDSFVHVNTTSGSRREDSFVVIDSSANVPSDYHRQNQDIAQLGNSFNQLNIDQTYNTPLYMTPSAITRPSIITSNMTPSAITRAMANACPFTRHRSRPSLRSSMLVMALPLPFDGFGIEPVIVNPLKCLSSIGLISF